MTKTERAQWSRLWHLADVINAEFKSDPMSVQCFDLRIVKELDDVLTALPREPSND